MNMEENTAMALKYSVMISITIVVIGIVAFLLNYGTNILWVGLLLLILSPIFAVAVTIVSLAIEKDRKWVFVAIVLICISAVGMLVSILK